MKSKLNPRYLEKLLNNECDVKLYEGLSENGEPLIALDIKNRKCRFVEKNRILIDSDGQKVQSVGKVLLLGDIAPSVKKLNRRRS